MEEDVNNNHQGVVVPNELEQARQKYKAVAEALEANRKETEEVRKILSELADEGMNLDEAKRAAASAYLKLSLG